MLSLTRPFKSMQFKPNGLTVPFQEHSIFSRYEGLPSSALLRFFCSQKDSGKMAYRAQTTFPSLIYPADDIHSRVPVSRQRKCQFQRAEENSCKSPTKEHSGKG
ncbi:hypothetical protein CEXT_548891 [Caerostris extrusa]|uniref:Uncharacterized protein n=1 Tax=Caerostris extrusa TaxID=172846 RepID=A0AAV4XXX5_CAEEX|nr:hypothetical protein CEXT_548891 [Caerostris extrusa]